MFSTKSPLVGKAVTFRGEPGTMIGIIDENDNPGPLYVIKIEGKGEYYNADPGEVVFTEAPIASKPVTFVDVERYKERVFLSLPRGKWGNRAKVEDAQALAEYLRLKKIEEDKVKADKARAKAEKEGREYNPETNGTGNGEATTGASMLEGTSAVTATKRLVNPKEPALKAITDFLSETADKLIGKYRGLAMQSGFMRGVYTVRRDLVDAQVEPIIEAAKVKLATELLPAFVEAFPSMIENARTRPILQGGLGPLFDRSEYPSATEAARKFTIESAYLEIGVSPKIGAELKARKEAEFELKVQNALDESITALRVGFAELVDHALEKLATEPGQKPKVFRDSLIGNLQDFVATFKLKDFGDEALDRLVTKAESIIKPGGQPLDPDRLRKFASVRDSVRSGFEQIKSQLDGMIVERKSRKIDVSED